MTYIGRSIPRIEDDRLLRGRGHYVADIRLPGMLHAVFVRSTEPHARVLGIEAEAARAFPDVVAVFTSEEFGGRVEVMRRPWVDTRAGAEHPLLAGDRVCYIGQPVAVVIAESLAAATDAAALVDVRYEPLEPLTDVVWAADSRSTPIHANLGDNIAMHGPVTSGDPGAAFAAADRVVEGAFWVPRISAAPLEGRGTVAAYDNGSHTLDVWVSAQSAHEMRTQIVHVLGDDPPEVHVVAPDVGGGFGQKHHLYPDEAVTVLASRRLARPVQWVEQRQENLVASHARGFWGNVEAALRSDGRLLGLRARLIGDLGAYHIHGSFISPDLTSKRITGPYDVQDVDVDLVGVVTNAPPMGPYRGAGQPEATFMMERIMDLAARELDLDPAEIRRRNLVQPEQFPYTTAGQLPYDTGNFPAGLERALELSGYQGWRMEQLSRGHDGDRLLGVGLGVITNGSGGSGGQAARSSYARVSVQLDGSVVVDSDVSPHGQGMPTTFAQLVADQLGVAPEQVTLRTGDTALSKPVGPGSGTYASRSLVIGGSAVFEAAGLAREALAATAALAFECPAGDVVIAEGIASRSSDPSKQLGLGELARLALQGRGPSETGGFEIEHVFVLPASAFTFAAHVAVVEVERATGRVEILDYVAVHDPGPVVNPVIVKAQIMGGIAQGLGEAMQEAVEYGPDGRTTAVSLMDYAFPLAEDIPDATIDLLETASTLTPMKMKGIGEAPAAAAPAAYANAVVDALTPLGVRHLDMPLTPEKVWRAIQDAPGSA